jgi:hypothetical protein
MAHRVVLLPRTIMSAIGANRTCREARKRLDPTKLAQTNHLPSRSTADRLQNLRSADPKAADFLPRHYHTAAVLLGD